MIETINAVKDQQNKQTMVTTNNLVANPDFGKIRSYAFYEYHDESFTDSLK